MLDRIINWINVEPTISLLMIIGAVVLFATAFSKTREESHSFWPWLRRIIEASVGAILFVALLWAFRSILNTNNNTFLSTHGSLSDASLQSAQSIWGGPFAQIDLGYSHHREVTVQEEIPREDPTAPPLYRNVTQVVNVGQNSITGFQGTVDLTLSEREKGYALYNGFIVNARYQYNFINDSIHDTDCDFDFALPSQPFFEDFHITMDGEDQSGALSFTGNIVRWSTHFTPHQQKQIVVSYRSRGMGSFYYQVPSRREIRNFSLQLTVDRLPVSLVNYPDNALTPSQIESTSDGQGAVLTWELDRAITTNGMGVALPQPEQPGAQVLRVLSNGPYALSLLGAMLALTLLIRGQTVQFLNLALLSAAYCVEFLVMAAISDYFFGFWGALILGAALTGALTYLLYRKYPSRLLRTLIYALVAFFTVIYPLSGLITDLNARNSFEVLVQIGLILYLFGLALYTQVERAGKAGQPAAEEDQSPA